MRLLATRWSRLSARVGRWPRRIAALCCLLLAAASAVAQPDAGGHVRPGVAARLRPGEVAIPLTVTAGSAAIVQPGDHVGVVETRDDASAATLLADRLQVLSIRVDDASMSSDASATVVVVGSRAQAVAVARPASGQLVLIIDDLP
jgi:Flp pilus assembly protein CpaB